MMKNLTLALLFLSPLTFTNLSLGATPHLINRIEIQGNNITKKDVILAELPFAEGETVSQEDIEEGLKNIRNTGLFNNVSYVLAPNRNSQNLRFSLEERWTLIPIAKVASGGGVSQLTIGVFDPNVFGRYIEAGFQYEKLGDTNSGVAWIKKPRLFGGKFGIDLQFWKTNRLCTKYDNDTQQAVPVTGFLQKRDKLYFAATHEFIPKLNARLFYEFNGDQFSDDFVTDKVKTLTAQTGLPPASEFHFLGSSLSLGRLNQNSHLIDGNLFKGSLSYGISNTEGLDNFWKSELSYRFYRTIAGATLAQRLMTGFTTTKVLQYANYLGGLDRIRGFSDNRFSGSFYWLSNTEYRYPLLKYNWMILQGVGFLDVSRTAEAFAELGHIGGASAGAGIRFVLPKIYRFVVRLDYAVPLVKSDEVNISFGVQQFF